MQWTGIAFLRFLGGRGPPVSLSTASAGHVCGSNRSRRDQLAPPVSRRAVPCRTAGPRDSSPLCSSFSPSGSRPRLPRRTEPSGVSERRDGPGQEQAPSKMRRRCRSPWRPLGTAVGTQLGLNPDQPAPRAVHRSGRATGCGRSAGVINGLGFKGVAVRRSAAPSPTVGSDVADRQLHREGRRLQELPAMRASSARRCQAGDRPGRSSSRWGPMRTVCCSTTPRSHS